MDLRAAARKWRREAPDEEVWCWREGWKDWRPLDSLLQWDAEKEDRKQERLERERHANETDEVALNVLPAWELVSMVAAEQEPYDWPARWRSAGDAVGWEGAIQWPMIALKTSPIWQALGEGAGGHSDAKGNAWPPFAFGSGMNRIEKSRQDCVDHGLLRPGSR